MAFQWTGLNSTGAKAAVLFGEHRGKKDFLTTFLQDTITTGVVKFEYSLNQTNWIDVPASTLNVTNGFMYNMWLPDNVYIRPNVTTVCGATAATVLYLR